VAQRAIELIMARNLMSALSTPAFLLDEGGTLIYYNDAAANLLGKRFEEAGRMAPDKWSTAFGLLDSEGRQVPIEDLQLTVALRKGHAYHSRFRIRSVDGSEHSIEVSAFPILTANGARGAMAIFWPAEEAE
jgi:PAS domain S-box-containing protein